LREREFDESVLQIDLSVVDSEHDLAAICRQRRRVNAMTQEEVNRIAGKIDSMPAGASSNGWWWALGVIVIGVAIWYFYK
jgi:hypothetical protein